MPLTPCFDPSTGAPGGTAPAPVPAADGSAKKLLSTDFRSASPIDINSVGAHVIDGITWNVPDAVATTAQAQADGVRVVSTSSTAFTMWTEIPAADLDKADWICVSIGWKPQAFGANNQTICVKLASSSAADSQYDLFMTARRTGGNEATPLIRCRHAFRGSSAWTTGYQPSGGTWETGYPAGVAMMMYGSGYSFTTVCAATTTRPECRGLVATGNATGSMRARGTGQTNLDGDPPLRNIIKVIFNSNPGANFDATSVWLDVWRGPGPP